uniref:Chromo domain-containing protein n=1 Tax=Manihot esculenta TaxID=3983 RepID=A0A2C9V4N7_MANES
MPFTEEHPSEIPPLPPLVDGRVIPQPAKVIQTCLNRGTWEVLVAWHGCLDSDATWESVLHLQEA